MKIKSSNFLRQVINLTMPNTQQHYVHRVGRTARAGKTGRSVSLVGESERKLLKQIVKFAKTPVKSRVVPAGQFLSENFEIFLSFLFFRGYQ